MPDISLDVAEIERRIGMVRTNLRELVERSAAYSAAAALTSRRVAEQEAELELLMRQRDELSRQKS